jgi:hypothetical protein
MTATRVWILYKPTIYADLFQFLFESIGTVEVIRPANTDFDEQSPTTSDANGKDIILIPLREDGCINSDNLEKQFPDAKVLAISPSGERGIRREPGKNSWEVLSPFGLSDLIFEVMKSL